MQITCELITSKGLSNLLVAEVVISDSILSRYICTLSTTYFKRITTHDLEVCLTCLRCLVYSYK